MCIRDRAYGGDLVNVMYATPHSWTRFAEESADRAVVQEDLSRWDYRHQVLAQTHLRPWQLFLMVKWLELAHHLRPAHIARMLLHPDPLFRRQVWWTIRHIGAVWIGEIVEHALRTRTSRHPRRLRELMSASPRQPVPARPLVQIGLPSTREAKPVGEESRSYSPVT